MVQFNLLPEIKIQYLRARRQKRLVSFVSTVVILASLGIFALMLTIVFGVQRKSISDLNKDIKVASDELQATPELSKILTVQNQLNSLPALHSDKPVASRLYSYMSQVTPSDASIARLNIDFTENIMAINGSASSLEIVNKFTDTLKFTAFTTDDGKTDSPAFSDVVLSNFGRDSKTATYTITLSFDPLIFGSKQDVKLAVPNIISTRSQTEQPAALFQNNGEGQ